MIIVSSDILSLQTKTTATCFWLERVLTPFSGQIRVQWVNQTVSKFRNLPGKVRDRQ